MYYYQILYKIMVEWIFLDTHMITSPLLWIILDEPEWLTMAPLQVAESTKMYCCLRSARKNASSNVIFLLTNTYFSCAINLTA